MLKLHNLLFFIYISTFTKKLLYTTNLVHDCNVLTCIELNISVELYSALIFYQDLLTLLKIIALDLEVLTPNHALILTRRLTLRYDLAYFKHIDSKFFLSLKVNEKLLRFNN